MPPVLGSIENWIFDLDNTLYPARVDLFALIDEKMGQYIQRLLDVDGVEARRVQKRYFVDHGTTLAGLMAHEGVDPHHFLNFVHDIDMSRLAPDPALNAALAKLPGRKLIFTNGTVRHAENVAGKIGILHEFEAIYDIVASDYIPKPHKKPYEKFLAAHDVTPTESAMFEDMPHNLEAPHELGMTTVLVHADHEYDSPIQKKIRSWTDRPGHIHHMTMDLTGFLKGI